MATQHIKIDKKLEWLRPYLETVAHLVPLKNLKKIKGFTVPLYKEERTNAQIIRYSPKNYVITIKVMNNLFHEQIQKKVFFSFVLEILSHELSHLVHWEHIPDHLILQSKILTCFAKKAKQLGVKDTWSKIK